jgi:hypothetical protein
MPDKWSLFFPERFLRVGKNWFALYEVREQAGRRTLHRIRTSPLSSSILK